MTKFSDPTVVQGISILMVSLPILRGKTCQKYVMALLPASELPAPALVVRGLVPPEVLPRRRPVQGSSVYSDTNMNPQIDSFRNLSL